MAFGILKSAGFSGYRHFALRGQFAAEQRNKFRSCDGIFRTICIVGITGQSLFLRQFRNGFFRPMTVNIPKRAGFLITERKSLFCRFLRTVGEIHKEAQCHIAPGVFIQRQRLRKRRSVLQSPGREGFHRLAVNRPAAGSHKAVPGAGNRNVHRKVRPETDIRPTAGHGIDRVFRRGVTLFDAGKTVIQQFPSVTVAVAGFQHHHNKAAAVLFGADRKTAAGGGAGAGFHTVHTGVIVTAQKFIGIVIGTSLKGNTPQRCIFQNIGMIFHKGRSQNCHGTGRHVMARHIHSGTVGIEVMSVHPEIRGGLIHPGHKSRFGAADVIPHGGAGTAGRRQEDQFQHRIYGILLTLVQRHIGIAAGISHGGTVSGNGHHGIIGNPSGVNILKNHISGHQFGQTGRSPPCIGVLFIIKGAGITVQHNGGGGVDTGSRGADAGGAHTDKDREQQKKTTFLNKRFHCGSSLLQNDIFIISYFPQKRTAFHQKIRNKKEKPQRNIVSTS